MGLIKSIKNVLVEEVQREDPLFHSPDFYEEPDELVMPEVTAVERTAAAELIDDIYIRNSLDDKSYSIFKVKELIDSLPLEMAAELKKTTVLSILGSFGLSSAMVTADGERRLAVLKRIREAIRADGTESVNRKQREIEQYKQQIAALEAEISECRSGMKDSEETINMELDSVSQLIHFVEGV